MQKIKDSIIFKTLCAKDLKSRAIKLAIALFFMFLGYFNSIFVYTTFFLMSIYVICEFSMDAILWVSLTAIYIRGQLVLTYALMAELMIILAIKLILDIKNKKIDCKNWRFITIASLLAAYVLLVMLPLCKVYNFIYQIGLLGLVITCVLGVAYLKEINLKQFFILIPLSVVALCSMFYLLSLFDVVNCRYFAGSSFGRVERFEVFAADPNFTGAILICAISCWFVAYQKQYIKKQPYYVILTMLFVFSILTISKATILVLAVFALFVLITNIITTVKTKNSKNLLELVFYAVTLLLTCLIAFKHVDSLIQRIVNPGTGWWSEGDSTGLSTLTTGRTDLWTAYLKAVFSSTQTLLFGFGEAAPYVVQGAAHSTPIDYLFRLGFVPTLILVAIFIVAAIPYLKNVKFYNFMPIVCCTAIFCSIGSTNAKHIYMFAIVFLTLCCTGIENRYHVNNQEIANNVK